MAVSPCSASCQYMHLHGHVFAAIDTHAKGLNSMRALLFDFAYVNAVCQSEWGPRRCAGETYGPARTSPCHTRHDLIVPSRVLEKCVTNFFSTHGIASSSLTSYRSYSFTLIVY